MDDLLLHWKALLDGNELLVGNERRSDERQRVCLRAKVSGVGGGEAIDCFIRDASYSGCRIISKYVCNIPENIILSVVGISKPIRGKIVWRTAQMGGVNLIWDKFDEKALPSAE